MKPKPLVLAIAGLTACSGCQLTLFNCEAELPEIASRFTFSHFPMGVSAPDDNSPIYAAFVEGAISTRADMDTLMRLRSRSRFLIAFGTCALWGGVAAIRSSEPRGRLLQAVYGRKGEGMDSFSPAPLHNFVTVDFSITGCPPEKGELISTLAAMLRNTFPVFPQYPVCTECRNRENLCLLIERDEMCLGPLIQAGCNARCPAVGIKCEGCRGPVVEANLPAQLELLLQKGFAPDEIISRMSRFCPEWSHE